MTLLQKLALGAAAGLISTFAMANVYTQTSHTEFSWSYAGDLTLVGASQIYNFGTIGSTYQVYGAGPHFHLPRNGVGYDEDTTHGPGGYHTVMDSYAGLHQQSLFTYMFTQDMTVGAAGGSVTMDFSALHQSMTAPDAVGPVNLWTSLQMTFVDPFQNVYLDARAPNTQLDNLNDSLSWDGEVTLQMPAYGVPYNITFAVIGNQFINDYSPGTPVGQPPLNPVPEPETWALMGVGMVALLGARVRRPSRA